MKTTSETSARAMLAAVVRRHGAVVVAERLGVRKRSVLRWCDGSRHPDVATQRKVAKEFGLPPDWGRPQATLPQGTPPPAATAPTPPAPANAIPDANPAAPGVFDTRAEAVAAVERARAEALRLAADPKSTPSERRNAAHELNAALKFLAKFDGTGEVTVGQILRSEAWRRCMGAILETAKQFPGCCEAMGRAMRKLEAERG